MSKNDPKIDAYIAKSQDFAKPILEHIRKLVHDTCPEVEEKMKWSFPHFDYKGEMMCSIAAFKSHCAMTFWKASIMKDEHHLFGDLSQREGMGQMGKIYSLSELPPDTILISYLREAMELNEKGIKVPRAKPVKDQVSEIPPYFMDALVKNKSALATFEAFSPSNKKEYITWITEAKTEATRLKRLETAIEWMEQGKPRLWKYAR